MRTSTSTASSSRSSASPPASSQFAVVFFPPFFCGSHGDLIKDLAKDNKAIVEAIMVVDCLKEVILFFIYKLFNLNDIE